jgi:hypothetical protein
MDHTYRERHGGAIYRFKDGMLPSDFFRRNVVLNFQEDAIGLPPTLLRHLDWRRAMTGLGQEEPFPARRMSGRGGW